nr:hypothetical protein [uncultured Desulfobacter sp.]
MDDFDLGEELLNDHQDAEKNQIDKALEQSKTDPGALFEPEILDFLKEIRRNNPAEWARIRTRFKNANKNNSVTLLDKLVKAFGNGDATNESKADKVVALLQEKGSFFHNQDREPFVSFEHDGHTEVYSLQSTGFLEWAGYTFFKEMGQTAGETTLKSATDSLSGLAKYEGEQHDTFIRIAKYGDGYVIDRCSDDWSVVHIYPGGWEVLNSSPVKFWRTETMREIPTPLKNNVKGVDDVLWKHLNIPKEDRLLLLAFILECLRPETPFVIIEFLGGQGTSKSTTQSNARDLIDPNAVNLRAAPKTTEEIFVGAANNYIVSFNNLSHLAASMQDALCILATGGGVATREYYTNFGEALMETKRPVMMNGISNLATAQDLIDRTIRLILPEIEEYKEESTLKEDFLKDKPAILAAIYDLFAQTLKKLPDIKIKNPPRMADFARLGEAMSQVLGHEPGEFVSVYNEARRQAIIHALDGSPVALALQELLKEHPSSLDYVLMKDALKRLEDYKPWGEAWPKSPQGLGNIIRRNQHGLKAIGINVIFHNRNKKGVYITIKRIPFFNEKNNVGNKSTPSTPSTPINGTGVKGVNDVDLNPTQISERKKDTGANQNTPQETADVEYF